MTKKQKREYYIAMIINNLRWRVKDFKGMTFEEIEAKFAEVWKQVEDFIPIGSKEETKRLKRKGLNLEQEQLVPVEDFYVQALQVKHPIIDWKVYTEGQRSYWQIIRLGGSSACYQFFIDLLKQLDREDLNQLWALVKEYLSIRPDTRDIKFLEALLIDDSIFSDESSDPNFEDNLSIPRPPSEPPDTETDAGVEILVVMNDKDEDVYSSFIFVIFAKMFSLLSAESEDIIFNPGFYPLVIEAFLCWIFVRFPRSSYHLILVWGGKKIENEAKAGIYGFVAIKIAYYSKSRQSREKSPSMPWKRAQENESSVVNPFLDGKWRKILGEYIASAPLTLLVKSGSGIRPIVAGTVWRHLVSKVGVVMIGHYFDGLQFGVGVSGGGEAILHDVNHLIEGRGDDGGLSMLLVDFKNVLVDREVMLQEVRLRCPAILRWVEFCYSNQVILYYIMGNTPYGHAKGYIRVIPLALCSWALVLHPLICKIIDSC
nr:hypothetical protein [Tanacetum cinerariifolium]